MVSSKSLRAIRRLPPIKFFQPWNQRLFETVSSPIWTSRIMTYRRSSRRFWLMPSNFLRRFNSLKAGQRSTNVLQRCHHDHRWDFMEISPGGPRRRKMIGLRRKAFSGKIKATSFPLRSVQVTQTSLFSQGLWVLHRWWESSSLQR